MIKKFIDKLLGRGDAGDKPSLGKRQIIPASVHGIDAQHVDERAVQVVKTLQERGHTAYIVGGAVRDLLLGLSPKDFDVATDATPEEVKALFRRAFIIGRRFRIVHVVFGRGREHEVKGNERSSKTELAGMKHAVDASGRVLRDNVWGPQDEDAARRDFTINAMYYDPLTGAVIDYHGGMKDAKKKLLRMIGDPSARYREDPVRIIRAVRFAAKLNALGFKIEPHTAGPLKRMVGLLADVPQSRLFDEMIKLLQTGHSMASIEQLKTVGLQKGIYPLLDMVVERADAPFVKAALSDTDRRVGEGKPVAPSFLLACVLWSDVHQAWMRLCEHSPPFPALQQAIDEVFDARIGDVSGRGKLAADMREIWMMQPRFEKRTGSAPHTLVEQVRFRAGFDFMRLRADVGEVDEALADWWQTFSLADELGREDLLAQLRTASTRSQRTGRVSRAHARADAAPSVDEAAGLDMPKKRRRRHRRRGDTDAAPGSI